MKYDHCVKYKGTYYMAGEEVPVEDAGASEKENTDSTPSEQVKRSINEVKRMNKEKLTEAAKELEVEISDGTNNEDMKKLIIEKIKERAAANRISLE